MAYDIHACAISSLNFLLLDPLSANLTVMFSEFPANLALSKTSITFLQSSLFSILHSTGKNCMARLHNHPLTTPLPPENLDSSLGNNLTHTTLINTSITVHSSHVNVRFQGISTIIDTAHLQKPTPLLLPELFLITLEEIIFPYCFTKFSNICNHEPQ